MNMDTIGRLLLFYGQQTAGSSKDKRTEGAWTKDK